MINDYVNLLSLYICLSNKFTYFYRLSLLHATAHCITIVVYSILDCSIRMSSDGTENLSLEAIRASEESKESSAVHMNMIVSNTCMCGI